MRGYDAYRKATQQTADPRSLEYRLLGEVTAAMIAADKSPDDKKRKVEALLWNKKVWDNFILELAEDENQLPRDLRGALVSIGLWVTKETYRVMDTLDDCTALVEINTTIMQGLN